MKGREVEIETILIPSFLSKGALAERVTDMRFDCHLFLLTKFVFLSAVGSTQTFPLAQQLGLSANQTPAWLSAAGKVKQALGGGVMSGDD